MVKPCFGVYADLPWPVFFIPQSVRSRDVNIFYYLGAIINDYTHVKQLSYGYTPEIAWESSAEAQALNNELLVQWSAIHARLFDACTDAEWELIYKNNLNRGNKYLHENLKGLRGHLSKKHYLKKQPIPLPKIAKLNSYTKPIPIRFQQTFQ